MRHDAGGEAALDIQSGLPTSSATFKSRLAVQLDRRLWGGFSTSAIKALTRLQNDITAPRGERIGAAWALARWFAYWKKPSLALDFIASMHDLVGARVGTTAVVLVETECLLQIGRVAEARQAVERAMAASTSFEPDLCLAYANCFANEPNADGLRLRCINRVYEKAGYAPLAKATPSRPLTIDNLTTVAQPKPWAQGLTMVSVIVPAFNAVHTIGTAIAGLAAQTWPKVEIVIVDDHSADGTWDVIQSLARRYANIVAVRQDENRGAFAARNRGLEIASGDFTTAHDADDWSHPQKIESQVRAMLERQNIPALLASWVRVQPDLIFGSGASRYLGQYLALDYSSLMFGKEVAARVGAWDRVRASGDWEFIERTKAIFGTKAVAALPVQAPLAFGRAMQTSLTYDQETNLITGGLGVRRDYGEAATRWHRRATGAADLRLSPKQMERRFPAPAPLLVDRPARPLYDVLLVSDVNSNGPACLATIRSARGPVHDERRVALFHWPHFETAGAPINDAVGSAIDEGIVDLISAGEMLRATNVIVAEPSILEHRIDRLPQVQFRYLFVNADPPKGKQVPRAAAAEVLRCTLGTDGEWLPLADILRAVVAQIDASATSEATTGPIRVVHRSA